MPSIPPKIRIRFGESIGAELFFAFPDINDNEKTFLDADSAAGATSLSASGINFSANQYIVIGNPMQEKTELVLISGTPTSTSIGVPALSFPHSRGDIVRFIPYNQIVPERSTDSGANYSALSAIVIRVDASETYLQRPSDASTDYYRFRFYNSTDGTYSGYADGIIASGYADNTVFAIKQRALQSLGEKLGTLITEKFLNDSLSEGRREVDQDPRVLRWSFRTKFNTDIGDIIPGRWSVAAPTDLRDRNTYKNILSLRLGRNNRPVVYQDDNRFRQNYLNIAHSTLSSQITAASTTAVLVSSGDFDESGSVTVAGESISDVIDTVAYTGNTESTGTLTGVTGVGVTHAAGRDVWQGVTFGLPTAFTIDNATVYFDIPFADAYAGENIWMDYYQTLTAVTTDSQTLDEPDYDMYVSWLRWKIKYLKSNGNLKKEADSDYIEFQTRVSVLVNKEITGQRVYFVPDVTGFLSATE